MEILVDAEMGQPPYTQWFCVNHAKITKDMGKKYTFPDAIKLLREQFKDDITPEGRENLEKY